MPEDNENNESNEAQDEQKNVNITKYIHKSPTLRVALHGMSEIINTRLSAEELDICLELIEEGVHPHALAEVILHVLEAKQKHVIHESELQYDNQ